MNCHQDNMKGPPITIEVAGKVAEEEEILDKEISRWARS